jgi:DNA adenine methylase
MMEATAITPRGPLRAPFPWFGGKSRAAKLIWEAFGDVPNFVEPFAGSLAVLLARPTAPRTETVNDADAYLSNFWRAVKDDPGAVARHADWPVSEVDLHARHAWLVAQEGFRERMLTDPAYYDAKIAGWWVWGLSAWIGSGWCAPLKGPRAVRKRPNLNRGGRGVSRQLPHLSGDSGAAGAGIHASGKSVEAVYQWIQHLSARLRRVRVCCGDWSRVLGPSPTTHIGITGVLLDPPYAVESGRSATCYVQDEQGLSARVRAWALEHGDDPQLRIALCGYESEHEMPSTWRCVAWQAQGGYGNTAGNTNRDRERVWFSPHCLQPSRQPSLFDREGP